MATTVADIGAVARRWSRVILLLTIAAIGLTGGICSRQNALEIVHRWQGPWHVVSTNTKIAYAKAIYDSVFGIDPEAACLLVEPDKGRASLDQIINDGELSDVFLHSIYQHDTVINMLADDAVLQQHLLHLARQKFSWMHAKQSHFQAIGAAFMKVLPDMVNTHDAFLWESCIYHYTQSAAEAATIARNEIIYASCTISPYSGDNYEHIHGRILFHQRAFGGPTNISVDVHGFSWQDEQLLHGFHIHQHGRLGYRCLAAGGHFNPNGMMHGGPGDKIRHVGDLGNLEEDDFGVARVAMTDHQVSLVGPNSVIGKSVVVHRYEDDYGLGGYRDSRTTGHAGSRLGCCVIERQKTEFIYARCNMYSDTGEPDQNVEGVIILKQSVHGGPTEIDIDLDGFDEDDDDTYHAFHIHERGRLGRRCYNAGGHFNPEGRGHGAPWHADRHVGDLGNIRENERGEVKTKLIDRKVSLIGIDSVIGKSMVIHEHEDDMGEGGFSNSKTTGHAGLRLVCCVIEEAYAPI